MILKKGDENIKLDLLIKSIVNNDFSFIGFNVILKLPTSCVPSYDTKYNINGWR